VAALQRLLFCVACSLIAGLAAVPAAIAANAYSIAARVAEPIALAGRVSSTGQAPMEGVAVIARKSRLSTLVAVMSDASGRYQFPADRLAPGRYRITVRAAGFELLSAEAEIVVSPKVTAHLDLQLHSLDDPSRLAGQLTNLEWLTSIPGTARQRDLLVRVPVNCGFCHTLERIMRSTHTAQEFPAVIQRMLTYQYDYSSTNRPQVIFQTQPLKGLRYFGVSAQELSDYLASINLSGGRKSWSYVLHPLPRPTGAETRAVVTVFPIPRQPSVIHDLDVDSRGNVWYGNSGWDYIGRLDPRTGAFSEWQAPNFLPQPAPGLSKRLGVLDIQVDIHDNVWAAVGGPRMARFDPVTTRWTIYNTPYKGEGNGFLSPFRPGNNTVWTIGLTVNPDGTWGDQQAYRLHADTGQWDGGFSFLKNLPPKVDPFRSPETHYCYMGDRDTSDNFVCTDAPDSNIIRVDAATGVTRVFPTPTPWAYPRRGYVDSANHLWFGEFYGDRIGDFDLNTNRFREFPVAPQYISPYYARPDSKGDIWVSSQGSDRLLRLDPATGKIRQYLLPVYYDARKVVVDRSAPVTTIWLPNKNSAELIRVEVPD
jgi:virginiamycin B lyase